MLRECRRVLKPGGRLSGYVIHFGSDLTAEEEAEAARVGPPEVGAVGFPALRARQVGFEILEQRDETPGFRATCRALLRARAQHERALRQENGDEWFEEEHAKASGMIDAIDGGLLRRSLVVARKRAV